MKRWILFGILLLGILFLTTRERFEATADIKDPATWNDEEVTRIRKMVTPEIPESKKQEVKTIVGGFWPQWQSENRQITMSRIAQYLNTMSVAASDKATYLELLRQYYIVQGQSVFQEVRNTGREAVVDQSNSYLSSPDPSLGPQQGTTVDLSKSPSAQLTYLKQTIATYTGIPVNDDTKLAYYITPVQTFYDTKYLPNKKQPTLDEINGYVLTVSDTNVPTNMKASFKNNLTSILDYWFTEPSTVEPSTTTSSTTATTDSTTGGGAQAQLDSTRTSVGTTGGSSGVTYGPNSGSTKGGRNVWGPVFSGMGSPLFNRRKDGTSNENYPILLGGQTEDESSRIDGVGISNPSGFGLDTVIPPPSSTGSDPMSRFLPYARQPGTDITDPYRLMGKYSTSSYSSKRDPIPFLTDFSAFFK